MNSVVIPVQAVADRPQNVSALICGVSQRCTNHRTHPTDALLVQRPDVRVPVVTMESGRSEAVHLGIAMLPPQLHVACRPRPRGYSASAEAARQVTTAARAGAEPRRTFQVPKPFRPTPDVT